MNFIKTTIAAASIAVCCMGNQMPAKAFIFGDIPAISELADMMAKSVCRIRAGEMTVSEAALFDRLNAARRGLDPNMLQDPRVIRTAARRVEKLC